MADIGIVIVTYNSGEHIAVCIEAAIRTGAEVVVVDNASPDDTVEIARAASVRVIANAANLGFAAAANQGFAALETPYVLLLNPDAQVVQGLEALREACDLPGAAGAGGCLVDAEGRPQVGFMVRQLPTPLVLSLEALLLNKLWPNNPVNLRYRGLKLDYNVRIPVEQPAGAFLMIRRSVWRELGGFDEGYFPLWFEDVDFCRRAVDRGYRFYYAPKAVARHRGGHSIAQLSVEKRLIYWYRSLLRYSAKHFSVRDFRAVCLAVIAGSCLRSLGETILQGSFSPLPAYAEVVRQASRSFYHGWWDGAVPSGPK